MGARGWPSAHGRNRASGVGASSERAEASDMRRALTLGGGLWGAIGAIISSIAQCHNNYIKNLNLNKFITPMGRLKQYK